MSSPDDVLEDIAFCIGEVEDEGRVDVSFRMIAQSPGLGRSSLVVRLNDWLDLGAVRPALTRWLDPPGPSFELEADTFGILGVQLMMAIARAHHLALCDGCGETYLRQRKPQVGRRSFCEACGERVANRLRQRDRRARLKEVSNGGEKGK